jgi:hypothetical protein
VDRPQHDSADHSPQEGTLESARQGNRPRRADAQLDEDEEEGHQAEQAELHPEGQIKVVRIDLDEVMKVVDIAAEADAKDWMGSDNFYSRGIDRRPCLERVVQGLVGEAGLHQRGGRRHHHREQHSRRGDDADDQQRLAQARARGDERQHGKDREGEETATRKSQDDREGESERPGQREAPLPAHIGEQDEPDRKRQWRFEEHRHSVCARVDCDRRGAELNRVLDRGGGDSPNIEHRKTGRADAQAQQEDAEVASPLEYVHGYVVESDRLDEVSAVESQRGPVILCDQHRDQPAQEQQADRDVVGRPDWP